MVIGSMTRVSGPRGAGRFAGSAALAGERWLRLAWRGLLRPCRSGLVTEAMSSRDARVIWSDTPWAELSSSCGELVRGVSRPGASLVGGGAGFEAAVGEAEEPVAELAERGVVAGAAGALAVVIGARSW